MSEKKETDNYKTEIEQLKAQLSERDSELLEAKKAAKNLKISNTMMSKKLEVHGGSMRGTPFGLDEIGGKGYIEPVTENMSEDALELEAFMNEKVTIEVDMSNDPHALRIITPSVNAVNQPIYRGRPQAIRRKYVEALARTITTRYEQELSNPYEPDSIRNVPVSAVTYPFKVIEDTEKGKRWLRGIIDEIRAQ